MMIPTVVLACKSDLERRVDPQGAAADFLQLYDNGLVEVSNAHEAGKKKMRQAFEWLIKAVFRGRSPYHSLYIITAQLNLYILRCTQE